MVTEELPELVVHSIREPSEEERRYAQHAARSLRTLSLGGAVPLLTMSALAGWVASQMGMSERGWSGYFAAQVGAAVAAAVAALGVLLLLRKWRRPRLGRVYRVTGVCHIEERATGGLSKAGWWLGGVQVLLPSHWVKPWKAGQEVTADICLLDPQPEQRVALYGQLAVVLNAVEALDVPGADHGESRLHPWRMKILVVAVVTTLMLLGVLLGMAGPAELWRSANQTFRQHRFDSVAAVLADPNILHREVVVGPVWNVQTGGQSYLFDVTAAERAQYLRRLLPDGASSRASKLAASEYLSSLAVARGAQALGMSHRCLDASTNPDSWLSSDTEPTNPRTYRGVVQKSVGGPTWYLNCSARYPSVGVRLGVLGATLGLVLAVVLLLLELRRRTPGPEPSKEAESDAAVLPRAEGSASQRESVSTVEQPSFLGGLPGAVRRGASEKPTGEKATSEKPTGERPAGEKPTSEKPTSEKTAGRKPTGEKTTGRKPTGEKATSGKRGGTAKLGAGVKLPAKRRRRRR